MSELSLNKQTAERGLKAKFISDYCTHGQLELLMHIDAANREKIRETLHFDS